MVQKPRKAFKGHAVCHPKKALPVEEKKKKKARGTGKAFKGHAVLSPEEGVTSFLLSPEEEKEEEEEEEEEGVTWFLIFFAGA